MKLTTPYEFDRSCSEIVECLWAEYESGKIDRETRLKAVTTLVGIVDDYSRIYYALTDAEQIIQAVTDDLGEYGYLTIPDPNKPCASCDCEDCGKRENER